VVIDVEGNDGEEGDIREEQRGLSSGSEDEENRSVTATGNDSSISNTRKRRINDEGEELFERVLGGFGFDEGTIRGAWNDRKSQRKFRRECRYFSEGLRALNTRVETIQSADQAEQALAKVLQWLRDSKKLSPTVCEGVKSTVSTMYGYKLGWPKLSESKILKGLIKRLKKESPKAKKELRLDWRLSTLCKYLRGQRTPEYLNSKDLTGQCIVFAKVFGRLRITEVEQLDAEDTEPTEEGWEFTVWLKGGVQPTVIMIRKNQELALDLVRHLK
jgi:hypothetical protein